MMTMPILVRGRSRSLPVSCLFFLLFLMAVSLTACVSTTSDPAPMGGRAAVAVYPQYSVAVLDLKASLTGYSDVNPLWEKVPDYNAGRVIASRVEGALRSMGKFKTLDRAFLDKIIKEKKLSLVGITRPESEVFNLLNTDAVLVGEVTEFCTFKQIVSVQGLCDFNLKLIDLKTGEVIFSFAARETANMSSHLTALDAAMLKFTKAMGDFELPPHIRPGI